MRSIHEIIRWLQQIAGDSSHRVMDYLRARPSSGAVLAHWTAAAPGQRRVLLHAGLHKTGTTSVQQFLSDKYENLREQGLLYPTSSRPVDTPEGHHNLAWELAGDRRFRTSEGTLNDVACEIAAFSGDAILSSEDFESVLGVPARLAPLLEHRLLRDHAFTIVFWVRDQASYVESLFFEMLHHRMAEEAARFCESAIACGQVRHEDWTFCFDYEATRAGLLALPATLAVRPYGRLVGGSSVSDFLAFAGIDCAADDGTVAQRANVRIDSAEALMMFCEHRLGKALVDEVVSQERFARYLAGRAVRLSPSLRAALQLRFAAGNLRLARACGFTAEALAISSAPANSIPLEGLFSLRTQNAIAELSRESTKVGDVPSNLTAAEDGLGLIFDAYE